MGAAVTGLDGVGEKEGLVPKQKIINQLVEAMGNCVHSHVEFETNAYLGATALRLGYRTPRLPFSARCAMPFVRYLNVSVQSGVSKAKDDQLVMGEHT